MAKRGRPKGASFAQMVSFAEKKKFVEFVLETYMGDMRLATWMGNQLFGQAPQAIDLTSGGKELPTPIMHVQRDNSDGENKGA